MILAVLKDGTIPVAVARVVASDHGASLAEYGDELADSPAHEHVELFEVPDDSRYVAISWADGDGFSCMGFSDGLTALEFIRDEETGHEVEEYEAGRHWNVTYGEGDDESYGHVFKLGKAAT